MQALKNPVRSLAVYTVIPQPDGRESYLRVGGGYGDRDGATLTLDAIPISGKLLVRTIAPVDRRRATGSVL